MAVGVDPSQGLMSDQDSLVFKARALAQAHPLSPSAERYVNQIVARERTTQPQAEIGIWAGNGLTVGYCLRRIEEVEVTGERMEHTDLEFDRADSLASEVAGAIRTEAPDGTFLLAEAKVVETLDDLIAGEIDRRLDHWKGTVSADTWAELEEYIAWWVVKGYALRVAETTALTSTVPRILVACVGNTLRSDDGVGPRVAEILEEAPLPEGVEVRDFGIGGVHMVQTLLAGGYDALVLVDCADRGRPAGTVMIIDPDVLDVAELEHVEKYDYLADMHYTNPERALALAKALGVLPDRTILVGVQPHDAEGLSQDLSEPVAKAAHVAADEVIRITRGVRDGIV